MASDPELDHERSDQLLHAVREQVKEIDGDNSHWAVSVRVGSPASMLVRTASEVGADLILVGIGRHEATDRWFGTETALRVMNLAHLPVLAIRPEATKLPRRAVVAVDFSEFSLNAARSTLAVAADGAEVHLVHVTWAAQGTAASERGKVWSEVYARDAQEKLEELGRELQKEGRVIVHCALVEGSPADALLRYASSVNADLIAAGSHSYGFFARVLMGSVSTRLLRGAECSVLIAPPPTPFAELGDLPG
jgi:nucleotide-binding universal stress UspA family protein